MRPFVSSLSIVGSLLIVMPKITRDILVNIINMIEDIKDRTEDELKEKINHLEEEVLHLRNRLDDILKEYEKLKQHYAVVVTGNKL